MLVVEDDPASRRALVQLLQLSGFEVIIAATLADAVNQLAHKPDFVLLDLMLPDGTGTSVLTYVREHAIDARVAVTTGIGDWKRAWPTASTRRTWSLPSRSILIASADGSESDRQHFYFFSENSNVDPLRFDEKYNVDHISNKSAQITHDNYVIGCAVGITWFFGQYR